MIWIALSAEDRVYQQITVMTFETFSPDALQQLGEAMNTLSFGLFYIDGLNLVLEEELSEPEYQLLLAELNYAHLFNIG